MAVAKEETQAWMRRPGVFSALNAIIFLHYGLLWVAAVGYVANVAGRRFSGVVEGPPVLSYSVIRYSLTYGFSLHPFLWLISSRRMWSVSKGKGIKDPLTLVVIGGLVLLAFMMLIAAADFVVGQSPLKGSQSAGVGSILRDLGPVGFAVTQYFIILPLTAPTQGRMK